MNDKQRYYDSKKFESFLLYGKKVLFSEERIRKEHIHSSLYLYEIRHADEKQFEMVQLSKGILVNYYGTIISKEEITLDENGYRDIDEEKDVVDTKERAETPIQYANLKFKEEPER